MTDAELVARLIQLAAEDRKLTVALIEHLEELDRRKLHLDLGFKNLYDYCVRELQMSEGSAHLRISAMRLARHVPAVAQSIESGRLTLTNAAQVHRFVKIERAHGREVQADALIKEVEGMSTRECERKLANANPEFAPTEKERVLSAEETQITFVASRELLAQLESLREEWSHVNPRFTYAQLFARMAEFALKNPSPKPRPATPIPPASTLAPEATESVGRFPSAALKRSVLERDGFCCVKCGSRFQLEMDHIQPWTHGGKTDLENLQTLCRPHHCRKTELETPEYVRRPA